MQRETGLAEQEEKKFAHEIPSKHLPPVTYRDLPEPLPLRKVLGPSVVSIAIGLASGEFILWPYIASVVGLVFLWGAVVGVLTQYFINMEIERYTLATGETAITGFSRLWKPWGIFFCLGAIIPNVWPGWATSASTLFTLAVGGGNVVWISIISLFMMGIILTVSPVVYKTVEKIEFFKVGAVLLFLIVIIFGVISARAWGDLPAATVKGFGRLPDGLSPALVLGALAFAGAGGVHNLVQSNWIRDKGFGMGAFIHRVVSPFTGEDHAKPSTGHLFPQTKDNLSRWKGWWRVANLEQFICFFLFGAVTIILMSMLSYSTVFGEKISSGADLSFLKGEGEALGRQIGTWFETFFYTIGAISLFAGNMGILDYVGRSVADSLKVNYLAQSRFWSESKIYFTVVWGLILTGTVILLAGFDQPLVLLVISSSLGGIIMFVYSILLIKLNRGVLPAAIKMRGVRFGAMIWAVLFFGFFSILLIYDIYSQYFGG